MYKFSQHSEGENQSLYPWLHLILIKTLKRHDFRNDQGGRTDDEQWAVYNSGASTLHPPNGKHLLKPDPSGRFAGEWSFAADVCPYINGKRVATGKESFGTAQQAQFAYFLSQLKSVADEVLEGTGWKVRLGINWDQDAEILTDQNFDD